MLSHSERENRQKSSESVMDLIVNLIAKENMPVRIVESVHFTKLLTGKLFTLLILLALSESLSVLIFGIVF